MTEEDKYIGEHPKTPNHFANWLDSTDMFDSSNKRHRKLDEINSYRNIIIDEIALWFVKYHVRDNVLKSIKKRKASIIKKYGFDKFIDAQAYLPNDENTKKGNGAEIIFTKYLENTLQTKLLVHKLTYNPNTSQAMKGDDILLFDVDNIKNIIYLGESKFRIPSNNSTIDEILSTLGGEPKLPLSLTFISGILRDIEENKLADEIEDLQVEMKDKLTPIINIGFIIGNNTTHSSVENHHLYGDFQLNSTVINELYKNGFPIDLSSLIGTCFRTESDLFDKIRDILKKNGYKNDSTKLINANKLIIRNYSDKVLNPKLIFITLSSDNAIEIIDEGFKKANDLLHNIEKIPLDKQGVLSKLLSSINSLSSLKKFLSKWI